MSIPSCRSSAQSGGAARTPYSAHIHGALCVCEVDYSDNIYEMPSTLRQLWMVNMNDVLDS